MCPWDAKLGEGEFKGTILISTPAANGSTPFSISASRATPCFTWPRRSIIWASSAATFPAARIAFEAWEKGLLSPDRTNGLKLEWGNVDAVDKLLDMAARREGWLGNLLAEGPKQLAEALGGDAPKWAVHTKGGTPASTNGAHCSDKCCVSWSPAAA